MCTVFIANVHHGYSSAYVSITYALILVLVVICFTGTDSQGTVWQDHPTTRRNMLWGLVKVHMCILKIFLDLFVSLFYRIGGIIVFR